MTYEEAYLAPATAWRGGGFPDSEESQNRRLHWIVYAIADERSPDRPFYIGITRDLRGRMAAHNSSPQSAAFAHAAYLDFLGVHCDMSILGRFANEWHARQFETFLIATTPNLLNRDIEYCRRRFLSTATIVPMRVDTLS